MVSEHKLILANADNLEFIKDNSINLVITSPPYPMIKMWDTCFSGLDTNIEHALSENSGQAAFELMHNQLNLVWEECSRVLGPGGIACINIGDAVRTIGSSFKLFSNHSYILKKFIELGFDILPLILWRKQTNAPNKFMGSGMLPPGAYVTLEHEYILIMRKGPKREFNKPEEKRIRQESAYFWEERNIWFSDIWDFKGVKQNLSNKKTRKRSAAYPFELPYRLINMFSVKGDTVLDPFCGTGTTCAAAIASNRNSVSVEIDENLKETILGLILNSKTDTNTIINKRIASHIDFIEKYRTEKKEPKYKNNHHGFQVITRQEENIHLDFIKKVYLNDDTIIAEYTDEYSIQLNLMQQDF